MTAASGFWHYPNCPRMWCSGHADDSSKDIHTTDLDGVLGEFVIVSQTDGHKPLVAIIDLPGPQFEMTTPQARQFAWQLMLAADFADQAGTPVPTEQITRALAEMLGALAA